MVATSADTSVRQASTRSATDWQSTLTREHAAWEVSHASPNFFGRLEVLGDRQQHIMKVTAKAVDVERSNQHTTDGDNELVGLTYLGHGRMIVEQNGAELDLCGGQAVIFNHAAPARFHHPVAFRVIGVTVPASSLRAFGARVDANQPAMRVDPQLGAPWFAFLRSFWDVAACSGWARSTPNHPYLAESLAMLMMTSPDAHEPDDAASRVHAEAMCLIRSEYRDSDLTPDAVAIRLHVSRRTLFRAFEGRGATVGVELRNARLDHAARALRLAGPTANVEFIASTSGFRSSTAFHAQFLERFGTTPRRYASSEVGSATAGTIHAA